MAEPKPERQAVARVLAASGAEVVVSGRDAERARGVVNAIGKAGGRARSPRTWAANRRTSEPSLREAENVLGGAVDILVNNAGVYPGSLTETVTDDDMQALWATNIRAPHVLVSSLAPRMAERGSGVIVNIGSWMARVGVPYKALYPAAKAAIEQLTGHGPRSTARGVRVNTVAPGATATRGNSTRSDQLVEMTKGTPAGSPLRPIDIAYAVRFLASDEAEFVHGATFDVDGGIAATRLR